MSKGWGRRERDEGRWQRNAGPKRKEGHWQRKAAGREGGLAGAVSGVAGASFRGSPTAPVGLVLRVVTVEDVCAELHDQGGNKRQAFDMSCHSCVHEREHWSLELPEADSVGQNTGFQCVLLLHGEPAVLHATAALPCLPACLSCLSVVSPPSLVDQSCLQRIQGGADLQRGRQKQGKAGIWTAGC